MKSNAYGRAKERARTGKVVRPLGAGYWEEGHWQNDGAEGPRVPEYLKTHIEVRQKNGALVLKPRGKR